MFRTRTQKITFTDAELYIRENALEKLGRSREQEEHYLEQTSHLKEEWSSISDFILHDKFSFQYVTGEDRRKRVPRPLAISGDSTPSVLCRNDHPYFFTDDVEHFVLWKLGDEPASEEDIRAAVARLKKEELQEHPDAPPFLNHTYFQNPPSLMSIPEVHHAHILVQRPPPQEKDSAS